MEAQYVCLGHLPNGEYAWSAHGCFEYGCWDTFHSSTLVLDKSGERGARHYVVGQARQKRKRPKASPDSDGVEANSGKKTKVQVTTWNGVETKDGDAFNFL